MADDRTDTELVNKLADLGTPHWLVMEIETRLASAIRRVAPDRETLARAIDKHLRPLSVDPVGSLADALLASGVLGVPADQRTADRETLGKVIEDAIPKLYLDRADDAWSVAEAVTDAVLAVLVPADQVRAETLESLADAEHRLSLTIGADLDGRARTRLRERAAEYRNAVSAPDPLSFEALPVAAGLPVPERRKSGIDRSPRTISARTKEQA